VKISIGGISFDASQFTSRMTVKTNSVNGVDAEAYEFEKHLRFYDFEKSDFKRQLRIQGKTFELIAFNPNSPKNACSIRSVSDGKTYKCTVGTVKNSWV
jgi:hypothetical protein